MQAAIERVADRFLIRLAAVEAHGVREASAGPSTAELAAFADAFYLPQHRGKIAFGNLVRKLKELATAFKKAPRLWDRLKKALGVESLTDLPGVLKDLAKKGYSLLRKALAKVFSIWPLKLYTLEKGKLFSLNDLLNKLLDATPKLKAAIQRGAQKVGDFGEMLRKKAPTITGIAMVAIYIWIWFNVVEFEWDLEGLVGAFSGALTFHTLLASLPGSALGFMLNSFGFGTFTLLPYAIAARLLWMIGNRYVSWTGRGFAVDWDLLRKDFGVSSPIPGGM